MNKQGSVLTTAQFQGAPIERANLQRGFTSKKTPLKWIRFFRACVLQRDVAQKKNSKQNKTIWLIALAILIFSLVMIFMYNELIYIWLFFVCLITAILLSVRNRSNYTRKYSNGFDFFADYFSAFFTLIEEDLQPLSQISLVANVKSTEDDTNLIKEEDFEAETSGFIKGKNYYYQKEISRGPCLFSDGCLVSFRFTERMRNRTITKRGSVSGK